MESSIKERLTNFWFKYKRLSSGYKAEIKRASSYKDLLTSNSRAFYVLLAGFTYGENELVRLARVVWFFPYIEHSAGSRLGSSLSHNKKLKPDRVHMIADNRFPEAAYYYLKQAMVIATENRLLPVDVGNFSKDLYFWSDEVVAKIIRDYYCNFSEKGV